MGHGLIMKVSTVTLSCFIKGVPDLDRSSATSYPQKCKDPP